MNGHPDPPPEGELIEAARRDARLSVREAARRAGISEGWWRQVVKGYQNLSGGSFGLVRDVPAATIAKMAGAAGVTPEQMETEGQRADAAQAMRETRHHEPGAPAGTAPVLDLAIDWRPDYRALGLTAAEAEVAELYAAEIAGRFAEMAQDGTTPSGEDLFRGSPVLVSAWDAAWQAAAIAPAQYQVAIAAGAVARGAILRRRGVQGHRGQHAGLAPRACAGTRRGAGPALVSSSG